MADEKAPYPNWPEPATKGDLLRTLVYARAAMAKMASALIAVQQGRDADAIKRLVEYFEADEALGGVIDLVGGRPNEL